MEVQRRRGGGERCSSKREKEEKTKINKNDNDVNST
jgi:hypothetical protein